MLEIAAVLVTLTALFSYLNYRFLKLPSPVGVMTVSLLLSLVLLLIGLSSAGLQAQAKTLVESIDFDTVLLNGMLSFLLFAGALHVKMSDLVRFRWAIGLLATVGVLASTFLIGGLSWLIFDGLFGLQVPLLYWLLLGAILSPTDPIAVLSILKSANAPHDLEIKIVGESLFNDGVAVVVFLILFELATGGEDLNGGEILLLFLQEVAGGLLLGLVAGYLVYRMLKRVDDYNLEILLTVALVLGGFTLAQHLHVSGPLAMVVAGLLIGNRGRELAMSDRTRERLDLFWELIDELLNAVLFVLIGLEVLVLTITGAHLLLAVILIPLLLLVRLVAVGVLIGILRRHQDFGPHVVKLLTWGGIRGGISVALALSLPHSAERDLILTVTYIAVLFSILVQGLSIGRVVRRALRTAG
jgi:CPA1 family monovalent cation:H+ antiporter